jgi:ATP-dependent Lon protease
VVNLALTGNLGDVMKESVTIAHEYLKSHFNLLGLNPDVKPLIIGTYMCMYLKVQHQKMDQVQVLPC